MKKDLMFAYLIHLSKHMWDDENTPPRNLYQSQRYTPTNNVDIRVWDEMVKFLGERKYNTLLIDVGDAVKYESHPEISAPDAWDKDYLKKKLDEIRALGITPIPKLNFSCCHHTWLKEYRRMVSTPTYYKVCADVIGEVCEVFDSPEFIHLGLDEETPEMQTYREAVHCRQGDLWWNDVFFYFREAEKHGARPWVWSDSYWHKPDEFLKNMPKSVLQSNWYYGPFLDFKKLNNERDQRRYRIISAYEELDMHGYEQVPTASSFETPGQYNILGTVAHGKATISPESLRGYMVAPWWYVEPVSEYILKHDAHVLYSARCEYYPETL